MRNLIVAAAQSSSRRGDLEENLSRHVRLIRAAGAAGADLVVFPELSLTGYELDLARDLQLEADDPRIEPLREAARDHDLTVLAGGPWASGLDRPFLGAFLVSPGRTVCYAKIHVHESEEKYFAPGRDLRIVPIGGVSTAIAICADTSQAAHAAGAAARGAELYAASVMKTEEEYPAHAANLSRYARRHGMAVLSANHAGSTGGTASAGGSAFWAPGGDLVARADTKGEALLVARRENGRWRGEVIPDPSSIGEPAGRSAGEGG